MKRALCVGINEYPDPANRLSGCVNDAEDWATLLSDVFAFAAIILHDNRATGEAILTALMDMAENAFPGDHVGFTYSGHGTSVPDRSGDEADNRDEALYVYDGVLLDDELRRIIRRLRPGVAMTVITDSCFSGSITRDLDPIGGTGTRGRRRYRPSTDTRLMSKPVRRRLLYPERDMQEVVLTACNSTEYSYDAFINGRWNGAFTAAAIPIIRANPTQTYREFHAAIRRVLPSAQYPQRPQLEGARTNKDRRLFA